MTTETITWVTDGSLPDADTTVLAEVAILNIHDRELQTGKWGVSGDESAALVRMTKYESIKRWRANHPDLVVAQLNRAKARRLAARPPAPCPVMAALTGMKL